MYTSTSIINDEVISPLERCFSGEITADAINWEAVRAVTRTFKMMKGWEKEFHKAMQPYYRRYLTGTLGSGKDKMEAWQFVHESIRQYEGLIEWLAGLDFMELVESMAKSNKDGGHLFNIMSLLIRHGYRPYIIKWPRQKIEEEIEMLEVSGNRYRGEYFCIMLAYHMIECSELSDDRKDELEYKLRENWRYLLNVYSVMVKRIIGSGFKVFTQLANNVNLLTECHPYIHIFYNAILLRQDELFPTDKDKEKLVKHMTRMEDIMKDTTQEIELDELCSIIFGVEFETLMQKKRFKSYDELKDQVKQLEGTVGNLTKMMEMTVMQLKEAVEASVPISVIETQLLRLDGQTAWIVFAQLNALLQSEESWKSHSAEISDKILEKRDRETTVVHGDYYGAGATHEDHRKQMKITGNSATTPLLDNK